MVQLETSRLLSIILDTGHEGQHMMNGGWGMIPFPPMMIVLVIGGLVTLGFLIYLVMMATRRGNTATFNPPVHVSREDYPAQQSQVVSYCSNCGAKVESQANFCSSCATRL